MTSHQWRHLQDFGPHLVNLSVTCVVYSFTVPIHVHSQNGYFIWKWKFHSELAARGFQFSIENKMFNENVNPIPIKKIYFS